MIRQKLTLIIMSVTAAALVVAAATFIAYDVVSHRIMLEEEIKVLATITGNNCKAALRFDDAEGAKTVLGNLNGHQSITAAVIFSEEGKAFSAYQRNDLKIEDLPAMQAGDHGVHWSGDHMWIIQPITSGQKDIGTIALQTDLRSINDMLFQDIVVVTALFAVAGIAAYLLATKLQKIIVAPITSLADTAKQVSLTKNYELHAPHFYDDEVADLTNAFNAMLKEIEQREESLKSYRDQLEQLVEERTHKLKETNEHLQKEIAERETTEGKLVEAKEEAEKANRLKSQFLANMSHELRTPMNAILGFSGLLARHTDMKVREFAETIGGSGQRLMRLIDDVLDLAKVEAGKIRIKKERFPLKNLVAVRDTVIPLIQGKPVEFSFHMDSGLPPELCSDETKIIQVLTNLAGNAIKFTESGFVKVECSRGENNGEILFKVSDSGIGIKPEHMEPIFEEFYQVHKNRQKGSGLGLAISKQIVKALGGCIWGESVYGKGSTFYFTIPFAEYDGEKESNEQVTGSWSDDANEKKGFKKTEFTSKILIAEDEESNRSLYREFLQGYDYAFVHDGSDVLKKCYEERPAIVLMDIMMPVMNGEEALEQMRKEPGLSYIPVIAVTAKAMVGDKEALIARGFDEYLPKPIDENKLKKLLMKYGVSEIPVQTAKSDQAPLTQSEVIYRIYELNKLKFFQSKEIKQILEKLIDGTSGELRQKLRDLFSIYKQRDESLFSKRVQEIMDTNKNT
jgi:signal transduction histidine kinase/DNA-binding NarL/FixJ family response regulator